MTADPQRDRIRTDLIWQRLIAILEDQAQMLIRTAFSTTTRESGDLSAGLFDAQGRMVAQAVTGTPGHVNAMALAVGHFLERFPLDTLRPGDVLASNDPWLCSGHLHGGGPGQVGGVRLAWGKHIGSKGLQEVAPGDTVILDLPGGGGFGEPSERGRDAIEADLLGGYLTPDGAKTQYGDAADD